MIWGFYIEDKFIFRSGINIFLDGFIPTENLRFREESLSFKMVETAEEVLVDKTRHYTYPAMTKTLGGFKLTVEAGSFTDSEIIVMLGENGTGKTTFVRLLAGDTPDVETDKQTLAVSLKPQTISPKFPGTVRMLLIKQIKQSFMHPQFQTDVLKPMNLENIMDQDVKTLSGGELQRVAIVLALGEVCQQILHDILTKITHRQIERIGVSPRRAIFVRELPAYSSLSGLTHICTVSLILSNVSLPVKSSSG